MQPRTPTSHERHSRLRRSLAGVTERGATLYVLCMSDEGPDVGPHPVRRDELPAWLATLRRV